MSEHKKKVKHDDYLSVSDEYKNQDLLKYPKRINKSTTWWHESKKKDNSEEIDENIEKILQNKLKINKVIPSGGEKVKKIPQQMGSFETKTAGTVMVGYNRFKKSSDLGFTVMSDKDKNQQGVPERDKFSSNTYFGANFDGKEKDFEAGALSFKFSRKTEEFENIQTISDKYGKKDKDTLLYSNNEEEEELEEIKKEKKEDPEKVREINEKKDKLKKIKNEKKEKNEEFLNEIQDFTDGLKNNKIKMLIEADELIVQRKRIMELSRIRSRNMAKTKDEEQKKRKKRELELSRKIILIEELVKMLERIIGKEKAEEIKMDLFSKARMKSIGMNEFLEIIEGIKRRYNIK